MTLHGFVPSEEPAAYFQYIMVTDCQLQAYIPRQADEPYRILKSMYQTTLCQIPEDTLTLTIMITRDLTY